SAGSEPLGGSARLGIGGSLEGGALELTGTAGDGPTGRATVGDLSGRYTRPVFGTPWLRTIELGSVTTRGAIEHRLLGAVLTNEPWTPARHFDRTVVAPVVPTGWEAEVYQGGHLVGLTDGSPEDRIEADLGYGTTPVRVRMLGPAGQERVQDLVFVVDPRQVPAGELRYDLGAGACRDAACAHRAFGGLRYGV